MRIIMSASDFVYFTGLMGMVVMGQYHFLMDKISVFLAYIIRNTDTICDTGILSLFYRAMHYTDYTVKRVLQLHVVRVSLPPSVCDVVGSGPCRLEILEN